MSHLDESVGKTTMKSVYMISPPNMYLKLHIDWRKSGNQDQFDIGLVLSSVSEQIFGQLAGGELLHYQVLYWHPETKICLVEVPYSLAGPFMMAATLAHSIKGSAVQIRTLCYSPYLTHLGLTPT